MNTLTLDRHDDRALSYESALLGATCAAKQTSVLSRFKDLLARGRKWVAAQRNFYDGGERQRFQHDQATLRARAQMRHYH